MFKPKPIILPSNQIKTKLINGYAKIFSLDCFGSVLLIRFMVYQVQVQVLDAHPYFMIISMMMKVNCKHSMVLVTNKWWVWMVKPLMPSESRRHWIKIKYKEKEDVRKILVTTSNRHRKKFYSSILPVLTRKCNKRNCRIWFADGAQGFITRCTWWLIFGEWKKSSSRQRI